MKQTTLGQLLIQERTLRHLSQEHLAVQLDISQSTYSRWESDRCQPSVTEMLKLVAFYGFNLTNVCQIIAHTFRKQSIKSKSRGGGGVFKRIKKSCPKTRQDFFSSTLSKIHP